MAPSAHPCSQRTHLWRKDKEHSESSANCGWSTFYVLGGDSLFRPWKLPRTPAQTISKKISNFSSSSSWPLLYKHDAGWGSFTSLGPPRQPRQSEGSCVIGSLRGLLGHFLLVHSCFTYKRDPAVSHVSSHRGLLENIYKSSPQAPAAVGYHNMSPEFYSQGSLSESVIITDNDFPGQV